MTIFHVLFLLLHLHWHKTPWGGTFLYPDLSFLQCPCFQDEEEQEKAAKKSMALQKAMEVKEVSPMSAANISIAA